MFLAVNVGNTHVGFGLYRGDALARVWRLSSNLRRTADEYRLIVGQLFEAAALDPAEVRGCMISSVIPPLAVILREAFDGLLQAEPAMLNHNLDLGLENRYDHPRDVGADRLANAVGAIDRHGAPAIVVDSGTATTLDIVSARREYLGGIIMPGLEMSADALFSKTSLLPRIAIESTDAVIGRTTRDAIDSGLVWGAVGAVEKIIDLARREIDAPDCALIATGGYGETLARLSNLEFHLEPDLTYHGIRTVWRRNRPG